MGREFSIAERKICPVCGFQDLKRIMEHFDDRYGHPDLYEVVECQNNICGLAFLKQHIQDEDLPLLYAKYYHHKSRRIDQYRILINIKQSLRRLRNLIYNIYDFYNRLENGQSVLDVGCGYGPNASFLKRKSIDWVGLEVDPMKVEHIRRKGLQCYHSKVEEFSEQSDSKFDIILVNQVIEHVSDPVLFLQSIRILLKDDGKAYLSTPNYASKYRKKHGRNWIHWHVPYHQLYFSARSFSYMCKKTGFRIEQLYTRTPFLWFVLQRNMTACERGQRNMAFTEKKAMRHLIYFRDISNFVSTNRCDEDCLYAEISKY